MSKLFAGFDRRRAALLLKTGEKCGTIEQNGEGGLRMANQQWYKEMSVYQIWTRSFCDGNGDGIGDFKGIQNKLDYLDGLGVTGIWMSPAHPSDSYHAYDVTDYYSVNPLYGTEQDFKNFTQPKEKSIMVTNPPYGERLGDEKEAEELIKAAIKEAVANDALSLRYIDTTDQEKYKLIIKFFYNKYGLKNYYPS